MTSCFKAFLSRTFLTWKNEQLLKVVNKYANSHLLIELNLLILDDHEVKKVGHVIVER